MSFSLESVGMKEGGRYETVYTTMNEAGEMNAASIGVKVFGDYDIAARIFEGSTTLKNIQDTKIFVVNIIQDPSVFARATFGNLEENEFVRDDDICYLKNADAYFIALVKSIEELEAEADHVNEGEKSYIIKAEPLKIIIERQGAKAINRGFYAYLESLVDYTRVDKIDEDKKAEYAKRFKENERLVERVGEKEVKESMALLKEKMIEKGLDL